MPIGAQTNQSGFEPVFLDSRAGPSMFPEEDGLFHFFAVM